MDNKKTLKYGYISDYAIRQYKKFMCYNCVFFKDNKCTKNRVYQDCAKKGLKNKE